MCCNGAGGCESIREAQDEGRRSAAVEDLASCNDDARGLQNLEGGDDAL